MDWQQVGKSLPMMNDAQQSLETSPIIQYALDLVCESDIDLRRRTSIIAQVRGDEE